jgi:hypothetical protein
MVEIRTRTLLKEMVEIRTRTLLKEMVEIRMRTSICDHGIDTFVLRIERELPNVLC